MFKSSSDVQIFSAILNGNCATFGRLVISLNHKAMITQGNNEFAIHTQYNRANQ